MGGGWGELYPSFFGIFLTLQSPSILHVSFHSVHLLLLKVSSSCMLDYIMTVITNYKD